jgi:hypothetical protein
MLIAAAGGVGYGVGLGVDRETAVTVSDAPEVQAEPSTDTVALSPSPDEFEGPAEQSPDQFAEEFTEGGDVGRIDGGIRSSGGPGHAAFGTEPMESLFERTTESGFALRARLGQMWDMGLDGDWGAGEWRPAPWCFESGQLRVSMSDNGVVDVGGTPWYAEPFEGRAVSWLLLGGNDGIPQWVIVVQAPAETTNVRVEFADGSIDQTAPQGGVAVLTVPGEPSTPVTEGRPTYWMDPAPSFQVIFEGGPEPVAIGSDGVGLWDDPEFRASCTPPPPALPDAGEPPADPAAAEAEIRAAMTALYGAIGDDVERTALIDDPTGIAAAREQVQAGGFSEDAARARATIVELVFTAPDEAWFRYSIDTAGNDFDNRYGIAVLVDGVWKITRATVCQDLSLAGGDCGRGWEPISPPSAEPRVLAD